LYIIQEQDYFAHPNSDTGQHLSFPLIPTSLRVPAFAISAFLLLPLPAAGQNKPGKELHIKRAKGEIVLDGILNEKDWLEADSGERVLPELSC